MDKALHKIIELNSVCLVVKDRYQIVHDWDAKATWLLVHSLFVWNNAKVLFVDDAYAKRDTPEYTPVDTRHVLKGCGPMPRPLDAFVANPEGAQMLLAGHYHDKDGVYHTRLPWIERIEFPQLWNCVGAVKGRHDMPED